MARGVCGKEADTAVAQDVLVQVCKGIAQYGAKARKQGVRNHEADVFLLEALFSTVTNVNFNTAEIVSLIRRGALIREAMRQACEKGACCCSGAAALSGPAVWEIPGTAEEIVAAGESLSQAKAIEAVGADVAGLRALILFGLKGMAAYADHALVLGVEDDDVYAFFHESLDFLASDPTDVNALVGMALRVGEVNLKVMGMLDQANTGTYGHPEPTVVRVTPVAGKCICVSGHDLKDLEALLKQTEGKGINIYTHGEMLPCCAYPGLKKYKHLVGNYGGAWQDQQKEFEAFPGPILMTTNCIQKPRESYQNRIFTTGLVRWPGVKNIADGDFSPVIEAALAAPGFAQDEEAKTITIGFGHNTVMSVAGTVIEAVKAGKIRHFFLIGGCDGAKPGRNYYTDFAMAVPDDCVILTLACGKYRFNKLEFGDIGGIPRLLDMGQCNDAYSAIQVAVALAGAFNCGVNELPLSMILSWYEQKAVCILLTLLHLGIQDMRLGPSLPAFVGPNVLNVLVEKFGLKPITTAEEDLKAILG
jgi:hydroxylamine reductase